MTRASQSWRLTLLRPGWTEGLQKATPRDLPSPPRFVEGWHFGRPDVVIDIGQDFLVSVGNDLYKDFVVPTNFTEGKWIRAAEVLAGNRKLVHHAHVYVISEEVASAPMAARKSTAEQTGRVCRYRGWIIAGA
jgi:hypothetical protein